MPLTPIEVRKKSFTMQLRGYAPTEVRTFLGLVANELEELRKDRAALAEKVQELSAKVTAYEQTEQLLKRALLTAEKTGNELREAARQEAAAIIERARIDAERLSSDLQELVQKRNLLLDEIRGICNTYLSVTDRLQQRCVHDDQRDSR